jgi:hypothetical protein
MDIELSLTMIFVSFVGLFLFPYFFRRQGTRSRTKSSGHPGKSKAEQVVTTAPDSFIPMPDYLRTKDEMVTWMARDLPRLTLQLHEGRRE